MWDPNATTTAVYQLVLAPEFSYMAWYTIISFGLACFSISAYAWYKLIHH